MNLETANTPTSSPISPDENGTYPNGYRFPKRYTWAQGIGIKVQVSWRFFSTWRGFYLTIYYLNLIVWGAMILFLFLDIIPTMCRPSCKDLYSSRLIWTEICGQVLNTLFCIPAFGLAPRRVRDFYYLLRWRYIKKDKRFHRKLAGLHRGWYRLPGSEKLPEYVGPPQSYQRIDTSNNGTPSPYSRDEIAALESNEAVPLPITLMPAPPLTGVRSTPTRLWCLDIFIGMSLANTMLQMLYASIL
jgi:hypothetical protein